MYGTVRVQHESDGKLGGTCYPKISEFYYTAELAELVDAMLQYDALLRPSALELLGSPYVRRHLEALRASKQQLMAGLACMRKEKELRGGGASQGTLDTLHQSFPF